MEIIGDFFVNPSSEDGNKYEAVKQFLISRCQDSKEKRLDNLLSKVDLGDQKPSELYIHMEMLEGSNSLVNTQLLRNVWLNKLPHSLQPCIIAIESTHTQDELC